ncbi:AVAST type 3 anti-phage proein Avs3b [Alteromonas macleodii]|uniref:AVAST type 3 anti-phage proein Avs3b n=1 Tax=Alteromonas macleodii TaxID=28108 RepID=UPI001E3E1761|nr:AVAST type 3 anti-phage proein Avs3b [Alteromonas macleodii]
MSLDRSEAVVELGKRLVTQLKVDSHDILSSWMAHHIAKLIDNVEKSSGESEAIEECSQAILSLWEHRAALPEHSRPLGQLEPIMRTLSALGVNQEEYHFYRPALREAAIADVDDATKEWLDLAIGLDYSARLLIRYALRSAAEKTASESESWVKLAREAGANEGADCRVVRFILDSDEEENEEKDIQAALEEKLTKLEGFVALANELVGNLKAELEAIKA